MSEKKTQSANRKYLWITACISYLVLFSVFGQITQAAEAVGDWTVYAIAPTVDNGTYLIGSPEELAWIAQQVNLGNTFEECTVSLQNNLDLAGHYWKPIGNLHHAFSGTFEGNYHVISNLTIGTPSAPNIVDLPAGLFGRVENGSLCNLSLSNVAIYSKCSFEGAFINAGALVGSADSAAINTCSSSGIVSLEGKGEGAAGGVGGLIGNSSFVANFSSITNCSSACIVYGRWAMGAGGFMGSGNSCTVTDCSASGDVLLLEDDNPYGSCGGGLMGGLNYGAIRNCHASGNVTSGHNYTSLGGLVGGCDDNRVSGCSASGNIKCTGNECLAGGFAGSIQGSTFGGTVSNSFATGNVLVGKKGYGGGFSGSQLNPASNCYATGNVSSGYYGEVPNYNNYLLPDLNSYIGGFSGNVNHAVIENSFATGSVEGYYFVGGFVGLAENGANLINSYAAGYVNAGKNTYAGSFAGFAIDSGVTNAYYNSDSVYINGVKKTDAVGIFINAETKRSTDQYISSIEYKIKADTTTVKSEADMKSADFVNLLNAYVNIFPGYLFWDGNAQSNNGYPVLQGLTYPGSNLTQPNATQTSGDSVTALATSAKVQFDGKPVILQAYNIFGSNYFKLRDIAMLMNGSDRTFNVMWNDELKAIELKSATPYISVGGELAATGEPIDKNAVFNTAKTYLDGEERYFSSYTIDGNNYYKLRDLGSTFNFAVEWDNATNTIRILSTEGYSA